MEHSDLKPLGRSSLNVPASVSAMTWGDAKAGRLHPAKIDRRHLADHARRLSSCAWARDCPRH
jgi:hypothetical protein